jgi:hypothetical protein
VGRLTEQGELQYLEERMRCYAGRRKVLMTIALRELEAENSGDSAAV